jgi:hypothetical protein
VGSNPSSRRCAARGMQKCPGRRWAGVASVIVPSLTWQPTNLTLEVNLLTNLHQKFSQSTCLQTSSFTRLFCPFHVKCTSLWIAHERSNFHFVLCRPCRLAHRVSSTPLQTPRICPFIPAPSFLINLLHCDFVSSCSHHCSRLTPVHQPLAELSLANNL